MRHLATRLLSLVLLTMRVLSTNYSESLAFLNSRLADTNYSPQLRPLIDQKDLIKVEVAFELVSIVEVNDVTQSFTINGFLFFTWTDQLVAMTFSSTELTFSVKDPHVRTSYYTINGEWDLKSTKIETSDLNASYVNLSSIQITFELKRRPAFFLLNVLLPVVFLSFLNICVFVIPAESGEKIGYGITVLLSLTVYMSTVSGMLPRSSLTLPNVIIYLFILFILSMITVLCNIIIVLLHNMEEKKEVYLRAQDNFSSAFTRVNLINRAISSMSNPDKSPNLSANKTLKMNGTDVTSGEERKDVTRPKVNNYKLIGRHINFVFFVVFIIIYAAVTLGFICNIALSEE
ncbi:neuronal acetylcholine receptor subunit alpha-6-like isoform X2 [Biomphalaria glabrata]|uniref:Neuronal acetylcholine receptor subunit alpha-6-like isoform X2 n=1 Tax=Biomphalaria glabrata TaxID=6526 RepID=A0A9W3B482_BIOGL|nr:neuronal acetylcholine receptor subunit alpha-6-like isoform X2 [Biomphalaria glabrata]